MSNLYQIRADYDARTVVVYQAYRDAIADAALEAQRFVPPFSLRRMTWIKPSFLWMMHRSRWAGKKGQGRVLAVRIHRDAWEHALSMGVLTQPEPSVHGSYEAWRGTFDKARVHVQWDTERSIRGRALDHYSIQVGVGRGVIEEYASNWIVSITEETERAHKIARLMREGRSKQAARHLPRERVYPVSADVGAHLLISGG